jgi:4-hydroxy-2-oxoheptanedioate aldolase
MRKPDGTFPTPAEHEAAIQKVIEVGKKVGCPTGIHAMDPENGLERAKQGMQFLAVGSELRFMSQKAEETLAILHPDRSKKDVARY